MKIYFPCLTIIMPGKYQVDLVTLDDDGLEINLDSYRNYGKWFGEDTKEIIKTISKNNSDLEELKELYNSAKDDKKSIDNKKKELLESYKKENETFNGINSQDGLYRDYIFGWAMLFSKNNDSDGCAPCIGEDLWNAREKYFIMVKSLHTIDLKTRITYLLNESLQSVARLWDYNNNRFEKIDGASLDDISYRAYQEMEISLSSINSNIKKMISIVVDEEDFESYKMELGESYDELLSNVKDTSFYLELYRKMTENLITQIHTESHIKELVTNKTMSETLERFTWVSIIMLIPMFITSYLGMNIIGTELPITPGLIAIIPCAIIVCCFIFFWGIKKRS